MDIGPKSTSPKTRHPTVRLGQQEVKTAGTQRNNTDVEGSGARKPRLFGAKVWLNKKNAAAHLGLSPDQFEVYMDEIPHTQPQPSSPCPKRWHIKDLDEWMRKHLVGVAEAPTTPPTKKETRGRKPKSTSVKQFY